MKGGRFLDYLGDYQLLKRGSDPWIHCLISKQMWNVRSYGLTKIEVCLLLSAMKF